MVMKRLLVASMLIFGHVSMNALAPAGLSGCTKACPVGLINCTGAVCWMNAALQCLFNMDDFNKQAKKITYAPDSLAQAYVQLFDKYQAFTGKTLPRENSEPFITKIHAAIPHFTTVQQQDSQEGMFAIINSLLEDGSLYVKLRSDVVPFLNNYFEKALEKKISESVDLKKKQDLQSQLATIQKHGVLVNDALLNKALGVSNVGANLDANIDSDAALREKFNIYSAAVKSQLEKIDQKALQRERADLQALRSLLTIIVQTTDSYKGAEVSSKYDNALSLQLDVKKETENASDVVNRGFSEILNNYFESAPIADYALPGKGGETVTVQSRSRLTELSEYLIIQIQCFESGKPAKIIWKGDMPLQLDMAPFMDKASVGKFPTHYALQGVVIHDGITIQYGHYTAYVNKNGQWYDCNDATCSKVPNEKLEGSPYILIYKRIEAGHAGTEGDIDTVAVQEQLTHLAESLQELAKRVST